MQEEEALQKQQETETPPVEYIGYSNKQRKELLYESYTGEKAMLDSIDLKIKLSGKPADYGQPNQYPEIYPQHKVTSVKLKTEGVYSNWPLKHKKQRSDRREQEKFDEKLASLSMTKQEYE